MIEILEDRLRDLAREEGRAESDVEDVERAVEAVASGTAEALSDVRTTLHRVRVVNEVMPPGARVLDYPTIVGRRLRLLREEVGWTQAQLAEAMARVGFDWKRITVAEVEGGNRKVALEELLALAGLYAVPMVDLLVPVPGDYLAWPTTAPLSPGHVEELVIGIGTIAGPSGPEPGLVDGGADWTTAAIVTGAPVGDTDWRPAVDLWAVGPKDRNPTEARSRALMNLGALLAQSDRIDEAIDTYRRALHTSDEEIASRALMNLGALLARSDRIDEAIDTYWRVVHTGDEEIASRALVNLGGLLARSDRVEEAVDTYQRVITMASESEARSLALANLATLLARSGRPDDAVHVYQRAIESGPLAADLALLTDTPDGERLMLFQAKSYKRPPSRAHRQSPGTRT